MDRANMMGLSTPADREILHTRKITCLGFKRKDGLYDIESHLIDTKALGFDNLDRGGRIEAGEALHEMHVRITLGLDLIIKDAEAVTQWGPFNTCSGGAESFKKIVGLQIKSGWRAKVNNILGRTAGCTHITELLGPMATTAFQTMGAELNGFSKDNDTLEPPFLLNSCHALADTGPVVKRQWPQWYKGE